MSMHEWYSIMYGVELPNTNPTNDKIAAFVNNHQDCFSNIYKEAEFPMSEYDSIIFAEEYEDYMGNYGTDAMIGDVIKNPFIEVTSDEAGCCYVGMFASYVMPWYDMPDRWETITRQDVQDAVKPIIEELYGECPSFDEHIIWYYG